MSEPSRISPPPGALGGWWRIVVIGALLVGTVVFAPVPAGSSAGPVRAAFTLSFLVLAPGLAVIGLLRLDDLLLELSLAVAVSLSLETVVAMVMLVLHHWEPNTGLGIMAGVAAIGALLQAAQVQMSRATGPIGAQPQRERPRGLRSP